MSGFFLNTPTANDINYDGFFDGVNIIIPDNTELTMAITDGFIGIEEGKGQQVCILNFVITTQGEFFGQKYKYNAKIYDMDASKRDRAMQNLSVLDAQAGFPMTNGRLEMTTENIAQYWVGVSEARVKMGLFTDPVEDAEGKFREIQFVRGFGYLRDKMIPSGQTKPAQQQQQVQQQQPTQAEAQAAQQASYEQEDADLDF